MTEIELHYCSGIFNFGDELSPYIINKITRHKVHLASSSNGLYAIGSLLTYDVLRSDCIVWGTGALCPADLKKIGRIFPLKRSIPRIIKRIASSQTIKADFRAVRGPLTRNLILQEGGDCPEIYGDPAIITPRIYKPNAVKIYKAGCILHHSQDTQEVRNILKNSGIHPIPINRLGSAQIESFIDEICSCEKIFSSSLHGIIIAQAYGIPAQWIKVKNKPIHRDASYKFSDYFLGVKLPIQDACEIEFNANCINQLLEAKLEPRFISDKIVDKLIDAFPDDVFGSVRRNCFSE